LSNALRWKVVHKDDCSLFRAIRLPKMHVGSYFALLHVDSCAIKTTMFFIDDIVTDLL